ncbi:MAG: elongation factor 4 [Candidatus Lloydbacteria bacterium RIFCSPHIGHO2_01_FULL_41_20]|uniref:Elongation factor 4 n=1 Tax=Candidatus Lloydbacteria bacterium RIFCSPHIGHO2_01_FULL_41_20 TaxID=1798657 RepID=A0A1G2CSY0_9BACT|nr:MAG: elongation factor 4 [Candidatus Lloydbacteria bacterium RIFCSPHIGHO2_01_FULL_41_20]
MDLRHIRNFSIIAHIDHGKSTLADRLLELTNTIEKRKMRDQVLDKMDLERERGITIKMTPVRMNYTHSDEPYVLNLIDTPGHIDFSYEVSRALKAVEGSILLVDATQGVQAQTLTTLRMAQDSGLTIIPVVSKIDSPIADIAGTREELAKLLSIDEDEVLMVSGRTGEGVPKLLEAIIKRIPPPKEEFQNSQSFRGLVFDFEYSNHQGVIVYVRVLEGELKRGAEIKFVVAGEKCTGLSLGVFNPDKKEKENLTAGEIGYIVTGIKKPGIASVGDTITLAKKPLPALPGYQNPRPVVWASLYPESQDDFPQLRSGLEKLRLSDSSLSFEEESSGVLGRGFRTGFLGMLHLEIVTERLKRESGIILIVTTPSINYEIEFALGKKEMIYSPTLFPDHRTYLKAREPWVKLKIITPPEYLSATLQLLFEHEAEIGETENFSEKRMAVTALMPLRELMRNFFDEIKSFSSGFASLSYEFEGMRDAEVARLDVLVAGEPIPAFAKVISKARVQEEAEASVEKLANVLPRQLFLVKIQGRALGRILSSRSLKALRKDVTGYLYGGDITRKMKLREKQKKGKKRMRAEGKVHIPHEVFLKMVRG